MILKLYHSGTHQPPDVPANKGLPNVTNLLKLLQRKGIDSQIIDIDSLSDEEALKAYSDAVVPSVFKKFGIRRVFGSRRRSGVLFGREIPALLVYDDDQEYPSDVYPHDEGQGKIVTIEGFLYNLQTELLLKTR
ncbi:hypothetical protein ACFLVU_05805 [Chloroflexota bacterium]